MDFCEGSAEQTVKPIIFNEDFIIFNPKFNCDLIPFRYGISDGTTTSELLEQFTGAEMVCFNAFKLLFSSDLLLFFLLKLMNLMEPQAPEPEQIGNGGKDGGDSALALSGGGGNGSHMALSKSHQRVRTRTDVDQVRRRLDAIENR